MADESKTGILGHLPPLPRPALNNSVIGMEQAYRQRKPLSPQAIGTMIAKTGHARLKLTKRRLLWAPTTRTCVLIWATRIVFQIGRKKRWNNMRLRKNKTLGTKTVFLIKAGFTPSV